MQPTMLPFHSALHKQILASDIVANGYFIDIEYLFIGILFAKRINHH